MKTKAVLMALAMMTTALAGCTSGTDGVPEMDEDALNELIQDNLQDFINNTTVVVNQDFHYHNNTTYVVDDGDYSTTVVHEYNNTTNIDGGEVNNYETDNSNTSYSFGNAGTSFGTVVNGTGGGSSMMFVAHIEFTAMDLFLEYVAIDHRNNTFTYNYTYYDYLTNTYRTEDFTYSCQVFYLIGSLSNGSTFQVSYWQDNNNYWNAWDNEYNSTIANMLESAAGDSQVRYDCDENYTGTMPIKDGTDSWEYNFLSIDIPQGYAIQYLQLDSEHRWFGCDDWLWYSECTDQQRHNWNHVDHFYNYSEGVAPWNNDQPFYGGWENITIDFDIRFYTWDNGNIETGYGAYSVWPTSTYEFTLYYQFIPVAPVE